MRNGICPNCKSKKIFRRRDIPAQQIEIGGWSGKKFVPMIYVCTHCGYMMQFVHEHYFPAIEEHWIDVPQELEQQKLKTAQDEEPENYIEEPEFIDIDLSEYPKQKRKRKPKRKNDES